MTIKINHHRDFSETWALELILHDHLERMLQAEQECRRPEMGVSFTEESRGKAHVGGAKRERGGGFQVEIR
jgi:hypothetical protein